MEDIPLSVGMNAATSKKRQKKSSTTNSVIDLTDTQHKQYVILRNNTSSGGIAHSSTRNGSSRSSNGVQAYQHSRGRSFSHVIIIYCGDSAAEDLSVPFQH